MNIDDVDGARPAENKYQGIPTRNVLGVQDIEGAQPRINQHIKVGRNNRNYNSLNYRDVTHDYFKSSRSTNPLMPSYMIRDEDGKLVEISDVPGGKPGTLPPPRKDNLY